MATYTGAPKVNQAVSATGSAASGTLYTCDSSGYAIIQITMTATASNTMNATVGTRNVGTLTSGSGAASDTKGSGVGVSMATGISNQMTIGPIHVGPGQAVAYSQSGSGSVVVSGVEFVNQS